MSKNSFAFLAGAKCAYGSRVDTGCDRNIREKVKRGKTHKSPFFIFFFFQIGLVVLPPKN